MTASRLAGRRLARLSYLGLPGAIALLVLAASVAAVTAPRPAAAARHGYDWVTSWGASPQDPTPVMPSVRRGGPCGLAPQLVTQSYPWRAAAAGRGAVTAATLAARTSRAMAPGSPR